jgi:succinate-semialdehyde dehydrogenase/glutarate-semialdehyde dehydrogenase
MEVLIPIMESRLAYIMHLLKKSWSKAKQNKDTFESWKEVSPSERCRLLIKAGQVLRDNVEEYAKMITLEMGKPIYESRSEVNKCAWVCDYYAENAEKFFGR